MDFACNAKNNILKTLSLYYHVFMGYSLQSTTTGRPILPHCIIEYSASLIDVVTPQTIIERVHQAALSSELFSSDDIKIRALAFRDYSLSDGSQQFIHITLRILSGRSDEQKNSLSQRVLNQLLQLELSSISLTVEVCDIDRTSYAKRMISL